MDDFELGCGATIAKYSAQAKIFVLALSSNRVSADGTVQEVRNLSEQYKAMEILGLNESSLFLNPEIKGQLFPECRQLILEQLYKLGSILNPDIVFVPSGNDIHHDHQTVSQCSLKAFKRTSILGYQILNSSRNFQPNVYFPVSAEDLSKKINAVDTYKSQQNPNVTTADYFGAALVESQARVNGVCIGETFAEAFECMKLIGDV